ncbi:MAG: HEAT repeat domain-containing protein, partial [Deltaproteobacteria bacterium]|nr:HEAT repeat domain-containing protein [Deltaproteobacteria bacterium]
MRRLAVLALGLTVLAVPASALAQSGDVAAQIKLIDQQPGDMDRAAWKEKRREAARKLVQSRDKKAVPTLIKLAETETFDIIGEIAIEGLGTMGDPAAAPVLQKIANDPARDKAQRDLARKALARLPTGGGATGGG